MGYRSDVAADRPNVVFLMADDLGYGDIGCFNDGRTRTPSVDELVRSGLCLSQHYSASPVCAPARAGLLTGRYPHRTGAVDTLEARGLDRISIAEVTIADYLQRCGYVTGIVGKWHNGAIDRRYHPMSRGFDEFVGFRGGWQDYYDWRLDEGFSRRAATGEYLTDIFAEEACDFLRRHRAESFFLYVPFNAPHFPLQAPQATIDSYRAHPWLTGAVATLYAMVTELDRAIGRILGELDALGLTERTLVLFTSDNGPDFSGEGENSLVRFNRNLNGHKTTVYEGGIRLPMILRWPGHLGAGTESSALFHLTDWLPTVTRWCGWDQDWDRPLDGVDRRELLLGNDRGEDKARFWQWNRYDPVPNCNAAMRHGDWKLLYPKIDWAMRMSRTDGIADREIKEHPELFTAPMCQPLGPGVLEFDEADWSPVPQLFNLRDDPGENLDRAASEPTRARAMADALETWFEEVNRERKVAQEETLAARRTSAFS